MTFGSILGRFGRIFGSVVGGFFVALLILFRGNITYKVRYKILIQYNPYILLDFPFFPSGPIISHYCLSITFLGPPGGWTVVNGFICCTSVFERLPACLLVATERQPGSFSESYKTHAYQGPKQRKLQNK